MSELKKYNMYIGGEWVPSSDHQYFESFNPATGQPWCQIAQGTKEDVEKAVKTAHDAFFSDKWADMTYTERGHLLRKLADLLTEHVNELAEFETLDNGKLIREMKGQLHYMPEFLYYYAGLADKIQGETLPVDKKNMFVFSEREPLGVVAAITPWNSPLYLTFIKLAPALVAGNTIVIKPSEHTSASILEFVKLVEKAGFPAGVVNVITGFGKDVGDPLTSHPLVSRIAFTGGEKTARNIVKNSSNNFAQLSLELGGKSPNIVFDDANLYNAAMGAIAGIFGATGQSCVAGSRVFIHEIAYEEFMDILLTRVNKIKIGDPMSAESEIGPVATYQQLQNIERYVDLGKKEGAKLLTGGKRPIHMKNGWYFEPTVFEHSNHSSCIMKEEIFGPVLSVMTFKEETDVINLANSTDYGLAAGIWTNDIAKAHRISKRVRAGIVWVNTYRAISPIAPIGGSKLSGYGREGGLESVHDYTQKKTVWINTSSETMSDPFVMR
ncbi:aldehyde dehydrogenase [Alteribacillus bidgolensis]|uniref:Aldehyde dehydrogenase (Acceptor) n=1 Tax=Alteribacillus bidgolensis TaxID=930129 RepID=A0A1G8R0V0_9BACI|nr:aldehyde dehydrogenase [Alteribacillus bidgolensis]SDJ10185.1 aldehyde dehydrogenase (acceptor) [Alteribacillus bidgolensis]